jgi:hypothetical protein
MLSFVRGVSRSWDFVGVLVNLNPMPPLTYLCGLQAGSCCCCCSLSRSGGSTTSLTLLLLLLLLGHRQGEGAVIAGACTVDNHTGCTVDTRAQW